MINSVDDSLSELCGNLVLNKIFAFGYQWEHKILSPYT